MDLLNLIAATIGVVGEVLIGISVYFVHRLVAKEKKIDRHILVGFHREKIFAIWGIFLIVLGYILQNFI